MKSILVTLAIFFTCLPQSFAAAASCAGLFTESRAGDIVVTEPLLRALSAKRVTVQRAFLVIDLERHTPVQFVAFMKREYRLTAKFGKQFSIGLQHVEVVGLSSELMRFLGNPYAQKAVLWAGKTSGKRFVESLERTYFNPSPFGENSISNKNRSHLEPYPLGQDPNRGEPNRGTPAFLEDAPSEPQLTPEF